jgi:hypothetical protein
MSAPLRESRHIDRRQATNFFAAIRFAERQGRLLNILVTFNLDHTTCPPEHVSAAFKKLRKDRFARWLGYRAGKRPQYGSATYVWVIENSGGDTHVHWAVHIPKPLRAQFKAKLRPWLTDVAGVIECEQSAIHTEPIGGARGLGKYMMKGIDRRCARMNYVRPSPQGVVCGKRCGISESLGPTARKRTQEQHAAWPVQRGHRLIDDSPE